MIPLSSGGSGYPSIVCVFPAPVCHRWQRQGGKWEHVEVILEAVIIWYGYVFILP